MEDFHEFVESMNPISKESMSHLLMMEADFKTL